MRVLSKGRSEFQAKCSRCSCRFAYKLADLHRNYVRGGEFVGCPSCGEGHRHISSEWGLS